MFSFDAWQLLGLTPRSSLDDARRAYYELARIVHPDRGGNADDMRMLHEAYRWVYEQLVGATLPITVEDPSKTPIIDNILGMDRASLEACYDKVASTNSSANERTMALDWVKYLVERDLMMGKDLDSIESYIQESLGVVKGSQAGMYHASVPDGYGDMMDPHEGVSDYSNVADDKKMPGISFSKELAVYKEPLCPSNFDLVKESLIVPKTLDDYSGNKERFTMTDYAIAHTHHVISNPALYEQEREKSNEDVEQRLGKVLEEKLKVSGEATQAYLKW